MPHKIKVTDGAPDVSDLDALQSHALKHHKFGCHFCHLGKLVLVGRILTKEKRVAVSNGVSAADLGTVFTLLLAESDAA